MILSVSNIRRTWLYLQRNGVKNTFYAAVERIEDKRKNKYEYIPLTDDELAKQEQYSFSYSPLISVVVPCYETKPVFLEDLILSLEEQTYRNFQIILADASRTRIVEKVSADLNEQYGNIVYKKLEANNGISENTNQGLAYAEGDYVALLDHDDVLTKDALFHMVKCINECRTEGISPVLIYSDEDKTDTYFEKFYEPNFKPKLNEDLIMTNNYICHLSLYRTDVIKYLKLRSLYDGAQDFDLVLRALKFAKDTYKGKWNRYICHVPYVLYHWRCHSESTADNPKSKQYAYDNGLKAVQSYIDDNGWKAKAVSTEHVGFYRVEYENDIFSERPEVGILCGPLHKGKYICGGAMNKKGEPIYKGLNRNYSGYLHRASMVQDVDAGDIRNMLIKDDLKGLFKETTGLTYPVLAEDLKGLNEEQIIAKSVKFSKAVTGKGMLICYDRRVETHYE